MVRFRGIVIFNVHMRSNTYTIVRFREIVITNVRIEI